MLVRIRWASSLAWSRRQPPEIRTVAQLVPSLHDSPRCACVGQACWSGRELGESTVALSSSPLTAAHQPIFLSKTSNLSYSRPSLLWWASIPDTYGLFILFGPSFRVDFRTLYPVRCPRPCPACTLPPTAISAQPSLFRKPVASTSQPPPTDDRTTDRKRSHHRCFLGPDSRFSSPRFSFSLAARGCCAEWN